MLRHLSYPQLALPAGVGVGITLHKARNPPAQGRVLPFSPLAGLEMKLPALGCWGWQYYLGHVCALVHMLRIIVCGSVILQCFYVLRNKLLKLQSQSAT